MYNLEAKGSDEDYTCKCNKRPACERFRQYRVFNSSTKATVLTIRAELSSVCGIMLVMVPC